MRSLISTSHVTPRGSRVLVLTVQLRLAAQGLFLVLVVAGLALAGPVVLQTSSGTSASMDTYAYDGANAGTGTSGGPLAAQTHWYDGAADMSQEGTTSAAATLAAEGMNTFRLASEGGSAARISLEDAAAAASRNGIDMRMLELRYESGSEFGFMSQTGSGALVRGSSGRIVVTLQDAGLASVQDAVETIAHELNHIRGVFSTGQTTSEAEAEASAQSAGWYFR